MTKEDEQKMRADFIARYKEDSRQQMRAAITTMRRFLDDASREIERNEEDADSLIKIDLFYKIDQVQRNLAWGLANASSDMSKAMTYAREAEKATI